MRIGLIIGTSCLALGVMAAGLPSASATTSGRLVHEVGHVSDRNGAGSAGVEVDVYAEPDASFLSNLKVGDSYSSTFVGSATTDASGRYAVDGQVPSASSNLRLVAHDGSGHSTSWYQPIDSNSQPELKLDGSAIGSTESKSTAVAKSTTTSTLLASYPVWGIVGQLYSTTTGATGDFQYASGATSELGVGVSLSGAAGSFSSAGTTALSSSTLIDFPTQSAGSTWKSYMKTQWKYGKFKDVTTTCSKVCASTTQYSARPYSFLGGSQVATAGSVPTTSPSNCTSYAGGSQATIQSGSAITWTNGVSMTGSPAGKVDIGIDLSSKTGYSTSASLRYVFSSTRHLCGVGGPPTGAGSPYQIVVQP